MMLNLDKLAKTMDIIKGLHPKKEEEQLTIPLCFPKFLILKRELAIPSTVAWTNTTSNRCIIFRIYEGGCFKDNENVRAKEP